MCRIAAYSGPAIPLENIIIRPEHSLLKQSQNAAEAKLTVNGDGFGISWYGVDPEPGIYRDVLPAWSDGNLPSLCRMIRSHLFIGHVRASTTGETMRVNCHPFGHGPISFCHNGQVPHYARIQRRLEADLPDDLYRARRGTTDSEMIFLTLLANGLESDPEKAIEETIAALGTGPEAVKLTFVWSDGAKLYGYRYASFGRAPTLYLSGALAHGGQAFASEPLDSLTTDWTMLPEGEVVAIRAVETGKRHLQTASG